MSEEWRDVAERVRTWGRWGAQDQLGTLNHITDQAVADAARLIRRGRMFSLCIPLDADGPQGSHGIRRNPSWLVPRGLARAGALAQRCPGVRTPALAPLVTTERLTPRERETALLAAAGRSSREIAQELHLSARTVENRLQQVYAKFGISSRAELRDLMIVAPQ